MKRRPDDSIGGQYDLPFDEAKIDAPKFLVRNTDHKEIISVKEEMTRDQKYILRIIFKNKIHEANGQKFEDFFTNIMRYADPEFQQIKPYGRTGDKKMTAI
jgi:hypothetical protein